MIGSRWVWRDATDPLGIKRVEPGYQWPGRIGVVAKVTHLDEYGNAYLADGEGFSVQVSAADLPNIADMIVVLD